MLGIATLTLRPLETSIEPEFPQVGRLGRIAVGKMDLYMHPDSNSQIVGALYEDNVIPWFREVAGSRSGRINQRFTETPNGYVWGGYVQPVSNLYNVPVTSYSKPAWEQACGWK